MVNRSGQLKAGVGRSLARLEPNGRPDRSFGPDGVFTTTHPAKVSINSVSEMGPGRVVLAGSTPSDVYVARYLKPPGLKVFVGYADSFHPRTGRSHPSPWRGSPKVVFEGCNYFSPSRCPKRPHRYDAGALRLDNDTSHAITVTKARVTIGACTFRPWRGLHVTVPRAEKLILTQTGGKPPCHTTTSTDNFDTSETNKSNTKCTKDDGKIPVFHVTVDGRPLTYRDTGQILNTGGLDPGARGCGFHSEVHAWVPIGS